MVADRDTVDDDHMGADPDVVADGDAPTGLGLPEDRLVGGCRVVEAQERRVGADAYAGAKSDCAAGHGERVQRAVRARGQGAGDVGVGGDVRVVAQSQDVGEDRRRLGHIATLAHLAVPAEGSLPLPLRGSPLLRGLLLEQPWTVVEAVGRAYGRLLSVIHDSTLDRRVAREEEGLLAEDDVARGW